MDTSDSDSSTHEDMPHYTKRLSHTSPAHTDKPSLWASIKKSSGLFRLASGQDDLHNYYPQNKKHRRTTSHIDAIRETKLLTLDYDPATGQKIVNRYVVLKEIGRGAGGKVKLARDLETKELVALKVVDKTVRKRLGGDKGQQRLKHLEKIQREIAILKKCRHPNVVALKEVIDDPRARRIYLVLEYLQGGDIKWRDPSTGMPVMTEFEARSVFRDVLLGLEYLHSQGIIHRDIKPANLLKTPQGIVKITDFGVSHLRARPHLSRSNSASHLQSGHRGSLSAESILSDATSDYASEGFDSMQDDHALALTQDQEAEWHAKEEAELAKTVGSPAFFAPELCFINNPMTPTTLSPTFQTDKRPPITKAIDVWALGVTLYCFLYGQCPFLAETEWELYYHIPRLPLPFHDGIVLISAQAKDLLNRLLDKDPSTRITLQDVKRHPWTLVDISNPERWLESTDPKHYQHVTVTDDEVHKAVNTWQSRLKKGVHRLRQRLSAIAIRNKE